MQEVIRERRACRNVFEVLDFVCVDYDKYVKTRLINLGTGRLTYANAYGLREFNVKSGITSVKRVGDSFVFLVMQVIMNVETMVTVDLLSGACSVCEMSKSCCHVRGVACIYPEAMVSNFDFI